MTETVGIAAVEAEEARQDGWSMSRKIWEMVKSRPDVLAKNLPKLVGCTEGGSSSTVSNMVKRKMLVSVPETWSEFKRRKPKGAGRRSMKLRVSPEMQGTYEWLPLLQPASKPQPAPKPEPAPSPQPAPKPETTKLNLDDLTIKEARALYLQLKKLFGEN